MRYLYGLLVISLAALLWAAMAIARHVRRHDAEQAALEVEALAHNASGAATTQTALDSSAAGTTTAADERRHYL
jgi:hypothetical protein